MGDNTGDEYIDSFNENILKLIDGIENIIDDPEISTYSTVLKTAIDTNKKSVISYFIKYVLKFRSQIEENDSEFFMNYDYREDCSERDILVMFDLLKKTWGSLNDDNKKKIFEYLQILCILSNEYLVIKHCD
jgi:hypothetical protein